MIDIVFDVETTGLKAMEGDRITEVGCVEVRDFIPTGRTFQAYVNPERALDAKAVEITGLTSEFLADKPVFAEIVDPLAAFIGEARIVAHNASFDRGFLNMELERAGRSPIPLERWVDTLDIARNMFPGMHNSLDALCKRFNISLDDRDKHGALLDSRLLAEVYLELNGGRERSLDLSQSRGSSGETIVAVQKRPRRTGLCTAEERAAHAAFLESLGAPALWGQAVSDKRG